MGKKIFVTYKYADNQVKDLPDVYYEETTVRNYVDKLQDKLDAEDHINKGENDDEDMSSLADSTIGSKLGDKIFDSSVTIVMISKGMKENKPEKEQWIPLEISYSLKEQSRQDVNSKTNAILAVVLPDENGYYDYYMTSNPACNSITYHLGSVFQILQDNMFNLKDKESNVRFCNESKIYEGNPSYISSVKWHDFVSNINKYIETAVDIYKNRDQYEIKKSIV
jgi:antiphage defense system Thoeris ThsB-like protein